MAAPEEDIFHGLRDHHPGHGRRFVEAADVASLHEHGVDLRIDSAAAQQPAGAERGGARSTTRTRRADEQWSHWVRRLTGRSDWHRER